MKGSAVPYCIKSMETEAEIAGKAFVHYTAWLETYPDLMPREYLERRSLEKCEALTRSFPENTLVALADGRVVGFLGYCPEARDFVTLHPASEITGERHRLLPAHGLPLHRSVPHPDRPRRGADRAGNGAGAVRPPRFP